MIHPQVYELAYWWYEEYGPRYYFAPDGEAFTTEQWETYVDAMLPEAIDRGISAPEKRSICWNTIIDIMGEMLVERGFAKILPVKTGYYGLIERDGEDSAAKILPETLTRLREHEIAVLVELFGEEEGRQMAKYRWRDKEPA